MKRESKILILIGIFILIYLTPTFLPRKVEIIYYDRTSSPLLYEFSHSEIKIPAIANINGKKTGVITTLKVSAIPGEGRTLTNIENLLFWIDTQSSIRVAKHVAQRITNKDISKIDLIYTIKSNASII
jgi:predicted S18 family serine protease